MARQFLTSLNLNKNELLNARIQNLANDPSNPVLGQVYFNTSANELRVYNGTEFEAVGLNGVTASAAELNILDGALITTDELNTLDGISLVSTVQQQLDAKAPINNPVFTGTVGISTDIVFEGATADDFETTLRAAEPTADAVVTLPNKTGTVILSSDTVNQLTAPTADFSMNNQKITGLATPTQAQDAATKGYVDSVAEGLHVHASVRLATTENITITGPAPAVIDGVTLSSLGTNLPGTRILVKSQTDPAENGIYSVFIDGGVFLQRAVDYNTATEIDAGDFVFVQEGTTYASTGWVQTNNITTLGTDPIEWDQFSGAGTYIAGDGLTLSGTTFNVGGTADRITVGADAVDIASTYVGQTSITTLGTVATGTWEGTDVAVAHGGTGASDAAGAKTNLGFMTRYAADNETLVPSSGVVSWTVTHNLGTRDVTVQVYSLLTLEQVEVDVARTSTSVVTLSWVSADNVSTGAYRVVVVG